MRLTRLRLQNYGNFADLDLSLSGAVGVDLLIAPNGAGKSVIRQALCEVLLGIRPQTPMTFRFDGPRIRLSAEVVGRDGTRFGFTRRKTRTDTLIDITGLPDAVALARRLPDPQERERLERLFALDSEQLLRGGTALLDSGGDLADALLSGAGELRSARALLQQLTDQRDSTAPRRRSANKAFYEAGAALQDAQQRLAAATVSPQRWAEREREHAASVAQVAAANAQAQQHAAALRDLQRVRSTRRHLAALDEADRWLAEHADALALPEGLGVQLLDVQKALATARIQHADRVTQAAALARQRAALVLDEAILREADAIKALTADVAVTRLSRRDILTTAADVAAVDGVIAGLLRQLGGDAPAADRVRPAATIAAARRLVLQAGPLEAARDGGAAERLTRQREAAEAALAALPAPARTEAVEALLDEILAGGDPIVAQAAAEAACVSAHAALSASLARVPGGTWDAAQLAALPIPADALVHRLDVAGQDAGRTHALAQDAASRNAGTVARLQREADEQAAAADLPDRAAVLRARQHRDHGWHVIARTLRHEPADEAGFTGGGDLIARFTQAIDRADQLADRRADEAERVQRAAALQSGLAQAVAEQAGARLALAAADAARDRASAGIAAQAVALGLPGGEVAEIRSFLAARGAVLEAMGPAREAAAAVAAGARRHADWTARLAGCLATADAGLPALLTAARLLVKQSRDAEERRAELRGTVQSAAEGLRDHAKRQAEAQTKLDAWQAEWVAVLVALGRPPGERPEATGPILDLLTRLGTELDKAAHDGGRVTQMQAQLTAFAQDTAALLARLGLPPAEDVIGAVQAAGERLIQAQAEQVKARTLLDSERIAAAGLTNAAAALRDAERALADILRQAGTTDEAAAAAAIVRSTERQQRQRDATVARQRLDEDGDGLAIDALRAHAAAIPPEALPGLMQAAEAAALAAQQDAQDATGRATGLRKDFDAISRNEDAARAATDSAAAQSRLDRLLEDALLQQLAASMLEDALKAVETTGDDPRLARIATALGQLTGGAYTRITATDGAKARAMVIHTADGEEKSADQLSEGTRDQLYLALRLVAIEDHAQAAAPALPFIADDILQTFDDARARAALEALAAFSAHTQVIVLTHHEHLAAIAATLPPDAVRVQRL